MLQACTLCTALGTDGFSCSPEDPKQMDEIAHANLHQKQNSLISKFVPKSSDVLVFDHCFPLVPAIEGKRRRGRPRKKPQKEKSKFRKRQLLAVIAHIQKLFPKSQKQKMVSITCAECKLPLQLTKNNQLRHWAIRIHAAGHLKLPLFSCRHCDYKANSKDHMTGHVLKTHKLRGRNNFVNLTYNYQNEVISMIDRCFGQKDIVHSEPWQETAVTTHCKKLLATKQQTESIISCSECNRSFDLTTRLFDNGKNRVVLNYLALQNHAIGHMDKPLFSCRQCDYKTNTRFKMASHLHEVHNLAGAKHFVSLTKNFQSEIIAAIDRCFGKDFNDGDVQNEYLVKRHCRQLCKNENFKGPRVRCNKCGSSLLITKPGHKLNTEQIFEHACVHLGKCLFACRFCSRSVMTKSAMITHLSQRHSLDGHKSNYRNMTANYKDDLIAMIDLCYKKSNRRSSELVQNSSSSVQEKRIEHLIRSRFGENQLVSERQLHCLRLVKQFSKSTSIKCRICSHFVGTKQGSGWSNQKPLLHSLTHVGKPLFRCRRCQKSITDRFAVYRHMKSAHNITKGLKDEFDDLTNDFHHDILSTLNKCYDWSNDKE